MGEDSLLITPATKVADLLEAYPDLEETLIAQAPAFARLRNPVLRRTVARVASLEQAASVGGLGVQQLVGTLRRAAGQTIDAGLEAGDENVGSGPAPEWATHPVSETIDADALLEAGEVPLPRVNAAAQSLEPGSLLVIESGFRPAPLLDALGQQGFRCHVSEDPPGRFRTYVARGG